MADKLLLRKGSLANLSTLPKVAGAISITTDELGIYLDIDNNTRKRLGDFIPVASLSELNDLAKEGLSETALYYAQEENVLARYSSNADGKGNPGLVWINDTTGLDTRIKDLEGKIGGIGTNSQAITNLTNAIGGSYNSTNTVNKHINEVDAKIGTSSDASTAATVYGAIAKEKSRAEAAENALGDRIDAIVGTGSGSMGGLQDQIDDLKDEDSNINNLIDALYGEAIDGAEDVEHNIVGLASELSTLKQTLGNDYENAEENIIEGITVKIGDTDTNNYASDPDGNKKITITLPKGLSNYDSGSELSTINNNITDNANLIKKIYGNNGTIPASGNKTIHQNAEDIATIKGSGWSNQTIAGNAADITAIKGSNWSNETIKGNADAITVIKGAGWSNETIKGNATAINNLNTALNNVKGDYTNIAAGVAAANSYTDDEIEALQNAINTTIASANAMTFKGVVTLPATDESGSLVGKIWWTSQPVEAGDTYVVGQELIYYGTGNAALKCHIGDLLVAAIDQPDGSAYSTEIVAAGETTLGWYLISTGYDSALESTLHVANNEVSLISHVNELLGSVSFAAPKVKDADNADVGSNIEITTNSSEIQFNLVWVEF